MSGRQTDPENKTGSGDPKFYITAAEAFPAIEKLILDAEVSLDISLHIFSPRTKTRNAESHSRQLVDWGDLLVDAVMRGVRLRLLINDFDPIGAPQLHANNWERLALLKAKFEDQDTLSGSFVIVSGLPGGQSGKIPRLLIWPFAWVEARRVLFELRTQGRQIPPRLKDLVSDHTRIRMWPPAHNYTQAFHQKFFIADQQRVILGGLDIDERRFDDTDHEVPAPETWHDVNIEFHGGQVPSLLRHFEHSFHLAKQNGSIVAAGDERDSADKTSQSDTNGRDGKVVITAGRPITSLFGFGPKSESREIEQSIVELVGRAERFIYAETQYFRSSVVRDAFIAAARSNPELHAVILLPAAPDVIAFDGEESPVHRYGEWLQMRALQKVTDAFDGRFAAFSLTNQLDRDEQIERDALHGKSVVYVHSKLIIRDDKELLVSSANLNGRSMQWDFEAGYHSTNADASRELRERLWLSHLGSTSHGIEPVAHPEQALEKWYSCARDWRNGNPDNRVCGVVPFPIKRTKRFAKRHFLIPENMV